MKKILFIVNPIAGGKPKEAVLQKVTSALDQDKYVFDVKYTEYAGHACELARSSDADIVVAIGGDGTQNEVARSIAGTEKVLGIIPCGSGDGLALHLGISRDPEKAAGVLNCGSVASMDYGTVCGHPFFCTTGVGIDAMVSDSFAKSHSRGLKTYVLESARTWFGFKPEHYRIYVDGELKWDAPASIVTVGNANQWGNNARITPLASVCDGLLDLTIVDEFNTLAFPALIVRLFNGSAHKSRHSSCLKGRRIVIERDSEGPAHYDGDPYTLGKRIEIETVAGSLKVMVPDLKTI